MASLNATRRRPSFIDLTGRTDFGRWTVLSEAVGHNPKHVYWLCQCECGTQKIVRGSALTSGRSGGCKPCGKRQHGKCDTPEYINWKQMRNRCLNPANGSFPEYGGRGVRVCEQWDSFAAFLADMGPRPSPTHSIDRFPNRDGNYEPSNCRWATPREQSQNRSSVHLITHNGVTQCIAEWSRQTGIPYGTLYGRLMSGWPADLALAPSAS
jgi:hypothetical protein